MKRQNSDYLSILSGTSQNVAGIGFAALAMLAAQVLLTRTLGRAGFGAVTVLTQAAFVGSFATRFGMDMAVLRGVAADVGRGETQRLRAEVARAAQIAFATSALVAAALLFLAEGIRELFRIDPEQGRFAVEAALAGLPFLAVANVWLGATRGLKIMRYTLYFFWIGQPVAWIVFMLLGWQVSETAWMSVLAYSASWVVAAAGAYWAWWRESSAWPRGELGECGSARLLRFAGPRAPAALFSQLLFWTDLFVLTRFVGDAEVGVYAAVLRAGQIVVLFLTSVNLMFSPYVADLHGRGEIERLDRLFKTLTRWILAGTLPAFLLIAVAPGSVLRIFGDGFAPGRTALLIVLAGQLINLASGSVGFVLIMVGRTGWDLAVYAGSLVLDLALAVILASRYGLEGAAIANAITFGVSNIVRLLLVRRFVGIQPYERAYLGLVPPALLTLGTMALVHSLVGGDWLVDLLLTGVVGLAVYIAAYFFFGMTSSEREGLGGLIRRAKDR